MTQPRQAVVRTLLDSSTWLRPEEIHRRALEAYPPLGLVTVYRTLELLEQYGFVRRIHLKDGCHGYASAALHHGHHLVCQQCQQAVEFAGLEEFQELMERITEQTGFVVEDHMLELLGVCPECQGES